MTRLRKDRDRPSLRGFRLGEGLPPIPAMKAELQGMWDVLMGRTEPPIDMGVASLMEVADAYYARAAEMTALIQELEREGHVRRGSPHYRFRTGELRTFMEMARAAAQLGSRRVTLEQMRFERSRLGRESW